jgi:hypothetical protein
VPLSAWTGLFFLHGMAAALFPDLQGVVVVVFDLKFQISNLKLKIETHS